MKDKLGQLETLLANISKEIENRLMFEKINMSELINQIERFQKGEISIEDRKYIQDELSEESFKLFYESYIPNLKLLLTAALDSVSKIPLSRKNKHQLQSGIIALEANQEFKDLLEKGVLQPDQEIFGKFKGQSYIGNLTKEGFFALHINEKKIACPDFKSATFIAWGKIIPNDGWNVWNAIDYQTGQTKSLTYFRNKLRQLN